jgi:small membrane protein
MTVQDWERGNIYKSYCFFINRELITGRAMQTLQVMLIIFSLFALTRVILRLKDKHIKLSEFIFWSILWILVIIVAIIPTLFASVASLFGISSGIMLLVYVSIIIIFYLVFRLYVKLEHQGQDITKLTRSIAINKELKKGKKE